MKAPSPNAPAESVYNTDNLHELLSRLRSIHALVSARMHRVIL